MRLRSSLNRREDRGEDFVIHMSEKLYRSVKFVLRFPFHIGISFLELTLESAHFSPNWFGCFEGDERSNGAHALLIDSEKFSSHKLKRSLRRAFFYPQAIVAKVVLETNGFLRI